MHGGVTPRVLHGSQGSISFLENSSVSGHPVGCVIPATPGADFIQSLNPRIPPPPEVRLTLPDAAICRSGRGEDEMSAAVKITLRDHTATDLRAFAAKCRDAMQSRRLLAIALILDGATRLEAARATGMDRQTLRDWVHHYNEAGLSGLISRSPPGPTPRLTEAQMAELRELVVAGT